LCVETLKPIFSVRVPRSRLYGTVTLSRRAQRRCQAMIAVAPVTYQFAAQCDQHSQVHCSSSIASSLGSRWTLQCIEVLKVRYDIGLDGCLWCQAGHGADARWRQWSRQPRILLCAEVAFCSDDYIGDTAVLNIVRIRTRINSGRRFRAWSNGHVNGHV
jgi:hypothetical protein